MQGITHLGGKLYSSTNGDGNTYIGPEDKATAFLAGTFEPVYKQLEIIEKPEQPEGEVDEAAA